MIDPSYRPRVLIADDEPLLRAELRESLSVLWPDADIVAEARDGFEALRLVRDIAPDVAFLDIRMPGMSGLDVARTVNAHTHVVFVTAFDEHAVSAFDEGAIDYVLKPTDPVRLAKTIARVRERLHVVPQNVIRHASPSASQPSPPPPWLQASVGNTIHLIELSQVIYFCAETKYTKVVTDEIEAYIRTPLKDLAVSLDEAGFWQIHRSYVVAAKRIASVTRDGDGALWVSLRRHDARLPVSQRFQSRFKGM